jgi:hypothetical protein
MPPPIVLVLQPPKAASMAWYDALRRAADDLEVHHIHHINPRTITRKKSYRDVEGEQQTIRNRAIFRRGGGWPDPSLEKSLAESPADRRPVKIVSTVRDPVARSISTLFFYADFWCHRTLPLSHRENVATDRLIDFFVATWRRALAGEPGPGTFEWMLESEFINYRDWFDREVGDVLSVDVHSTAFDFNRHVLRAGSAGVDMVVCRYEDLGDGDRMSHILAEVSDMIGVTIADLPRSNSTSGRRSGDVYREFRQRLKLPADMLDEIYSAPILSRFYRPAELAAMKDRWAA